MPRPDPRAAARPFAPLGLAPTLFAALLALGACSDDGATAPGPDSGGGDGAADAAADAGGDGGAQDVGSDGHDGGGGVDGDAGDGGVADGDAGEVAGDADGAAADGDVGGDGEDASGDVDDAPDSDAGDAGGDDVPDGAGDAADAGGPITEVTTHPTACSADGDCLVPCAASASCQQGTCVFVAKAGACLVPAGEGKIACYGDGMTSAATPCLSCNAAVGQEQLTSIATLHPLDGPEHGFVAEDLTGGKGKLTWQLSSKRAVSGGASLYFGDPEAASYANDQQVHAALTSPPMPVPLHAGVTPTLSFWLFLDTEQTPGYDQLTVEAVQGEAATELWSSDAIGGSTGGVWRLVHLPLGAFAGKTVAFRFTFDSKDGYVNAYEGAYLDDVSVRTGCCGALADCDDGNACSVDACAPGAASAGLPVCSHQPLAGCCASAGDCDDGKPCTLDLCPVAGGACSHNAKPGCCMAAGDCDDGDACTIDHCPKAGSQCQHTDTCCKADGDCASADPCLKGACVGGECAYTSTCCLADAECDDFNPCTIDACDQGQCSHAPSLAPGCCSPEPFAATFSSGLDGWTSAAAVKELVWHQTTFPHDDGGKKGDGVALLGVPGKQLSGVTGSNYVALTSPDITLPPGQAFTFKYRVKFDLSYKTSSQSVTAYAIFGGKTTTIGSVTYGSNKEGWLEYEADASALAGQTFKIELRGRVYGFGAGTTGWGIWLDDVRFATDCNPKTCTASAQCTTVSSCLKGFCSDGQCTYQNACCASNADCQSDNLCISATCSSSGICQFSEKKGCCMGAGDCDDGNACTADSCPTAGGDCLHAPIAGCCLSSSECNDNDKCTDDLCLLNKCVNNQLCCKADADCSDGESKCTTDTCGADSFCKHTPTGAAGCCEPLPFADDFSKGAGAWTFSNSGGPAKGWQVAGAALQSKSPPAALYYGDPTTKNFDFGESNGTATSPALAVPVGPKATLKLWLYMDTESGTSYDKLQLALLDGSAKKVVWTKASAGFKTKTWIEVAVDVSGYAGKAIKVVLDFDTNDGVSNGGQGVFIDDVTLSVACGS